MKSVSNPTSGTTPDPRSLTDLWREFDASICDHMRNGASPERDRAYFEANVKFLQRLDAVADRYQTVNMIRELAEVEPEFAWDREISRAREAVAAAHDAVTGGPARVDVEHPHLPGDDQTAAQNEAAVR